MWWHSRQESTLSLVVCSGALTGQYIDVAHKVVLGRGDGSCISLPDLKVSRRHASIRPKRSGLVIADLGSHNGTFVNGERVDKSALRHGDCVALGSTELRVVKDVEGPIRDASGVANRVLTLTDLEPRHTTAMPTAELLAVLNATSGPLHEWPPPRQSDLEVLHLGSRNFAVIFSLARELQEATRLRHVMMAAQKFIFSVTQAERCYVLLVDPESGELIPKLARHRDQSVHRIPLELNRSIIQRVISQKTAVLAQHTPIAEDTAEHEAYARSVLGVPILRGTHVGGMILLDRPSESGTFNRQDFELMTVISSLIGVRLENMRLFEERTRNLKALEDFRSELAQRERLAVLGQLTSGLAHEISNLMIPFGLVQGMAEAYPDDEELCSLCELMAESHRRISMLLREVRLMAKGEPATLRLGTHNLRDTSEAVVRFCQCDREVSIHHISVESHGLSRFRYDESAIKQVLINLLRNAGQAMTRPGPITIRMYPDPDETGYARVDVTDQGRGMSDEQRARLWEPFFSTKPAGLGLGLDISRRLVERHGGRMSCTSVPGEGTTMSFTLPLDPDQVRAAPNAHQVS